MYQIIEDNLKYIGQSNTQTRRLGYVTAICRLLGDDYYSLSELQRKLQQWAESNQPALKSHISDKGIIRQSGQSLGSRRYIELAQSFQLITEIGGYWRLTKTGRVLVALTEELSPAELTDNPFELNSFETLFMFYQLLLLDADYLLPIFELTSEVHEQLKLQMQTQAKLIEHFKVLQFETHSPFIRSEASERVFTLKRWTKPVRYAEHLTVPRLNWLLDLKLLNWGAYQIRSEFIPSISGMILLENLPLIQNNRFVDRNWCQNDLFTAWAKAHTVSATQWNELSADRQVNIITESVELGFSKFRTMQYPRISAYQLVLFTIIRLLTQQKVVAGFEDIKFALSQFSSSSTIKWTFHWTEIDDDGFLLLPS